jgi:hypothetical protein
VRGGSCRHTAIARIRLNFDGPFVGLGIPSFADCYLRKALSSTLGLRLVSTRTDGERLLAN